MTDLQPVRPTTRIASTDYGTIRNNHKTKKIRAEIKQLHLEHNFDGKERIKTSEAIREIFKYIGDHQASDHLLRAPASLPCQIL